MGRISSSASIDSAIGTIRNEDCLAGMAALPEGCIDLVFADPPFNIGYEYDVYEDQQEHRAYLDWSRQWIAAVHRVLSPRGTFWLAIGDEYAAELKVLSQEIGFHCRSWVVWYYTFGVNCRHKFTRSHAHLFYFVKDPENFTFRGGDLQNRIPSARQLVYADARANPVGRLPDDTWILRPQDLTDCFTPDEDTWYFPRVAGTFKERAGFHGCQMPEQLLGRIIRSCSEDGDVVLDPFSGSATTLVVARKLGRRCLGFELSADYARRGQERLGRACQGDPLDGAAEPTMSAPATPKDKSQKKGKLLRLEAATEPTNETLRRAAELTERGLIEAFRKTSAGFSLDRVVADPELDAALIDECRRLGLAGDARSWNLSLFRLRKAGRLAEIPTTRATELSWQDCDPYIFASEIAWRRLMDDGAGSLDNIFCDPVLVTRFDSLAVELAPGHQPLAYRWAALKLRKAAKSSRMQAAQIKRPKLGQPRPLLEVAAEGRWTSPGVYLLTDSNSHPLYVGESLVLGDRLSRQFSIASVDRWYANAADLKISVCSVESRPSVLLGYQTKLVGRHRPKLNIGEYAVA